MEAYMVAAERRPIVGFLGYFVDSNGVVWSAYDGGQMHRAAKRRAPIALRQYIGARRVPNVRLYLDGKGTTKSVHRLVALAFLGPSPCPGHHVRHLDGDSLNNRAKNLAWGSAVENEADKRRHGRLHIGERNYQTPFCNDDVLLIRARYSKGATITELARSYGVTRRSIYGIVYRRSWRHL
jgi:hypothetical protein